MSKRRTVIIVLITLICCLAMAVVEVVIQPGYAGKSAIKMALFLLIPLAASLCDKDILYLKLFRFRKNGFLASLLLGVGVYGVIVGGYFLVRPFFDFSQIAVSLTKNVGVDKDNFLFVALYISFVNSLLEEFFFRGFVFTNLKRQGGRSLAYWFSGGAFALYHVAMMIGWFSPLLFALVMAGLLVGGMIFNYLNERMDTICASWLVHMFANFAINTIGFMLLG